MRWSHRVQGRSCQRSKWLASRQSRRQPAAGISPGSTDGFLPRVRVTAGSRAAAGGPGPRDPVPASRPGARLWRARAAAARGRRSGPGGTRRAPPTGWGSGRALGPGGSRRTSFAAMAKAAGVSRSWLYTQQDLVAAIRRLQDRQPTNERTGPQPASVASIQRRLEAALSRIKQLRAENSDLTRRLETAYGEIRRLRGTCHSPEGQGPDSY